MAGVFEVEVDGVEHDHGLGHHNEPNQVSIIGRTVVLEQVKEKALYTEAVAADSELRYSYS